MSRSSVYWENEPSGDSSPTGATVDVATVLQMAYIAAALTILSIRMVAPLKNRFLAYGARDVVAKDKQPRGSSKQPDVTVISGLLDLLASLKVPHSWFGSFYVVSVASSVFWAHQILFRGFAFQFVAKHTASERPSMGIQQVIVVWIMMLVQGLRRLDESVSLSKPSSSTMHIAHWLIGIWFYLMTGLAVWIEGVGALKATTIGVDHIRFAAPSMRSFLGIIVFMMASGIQRDCHAYLASLKAYKIPEHPAFHKVVCPHYLAECVIYFAIAIAAGPPGSLLNSTVTCALVFVVVNLGVTADGTKSWYATKFGEASVASKWRMIPLLY